MNFDKNGAVVIDPIITKDIGSVEKHLFVLRYCPDKLPRMNIIGNWQPKNDWAKHKIITFFLV